MRSPFSDDPLALLFVSVHPLRIGSSLIFTPLLQNAKRRNQVTIVRNCSSGHSSSAFHLSVTVTSTPSGLLRSQRPSHYVYTVLRYFSVVVMHTPTPESELTVYLMASVRPRSMCTDLVSELLAGQPTISTTSYSRHTDCRCCTLYCRMQVLATSYTVRATRSHWDETHDPRRVSSSNARKC